MTSDTKLQHRWRHPRQANLVRRTERKRSIEKKQVRAIGDPVSQCRQIFGTADYYLKHFGLLDSHLRGNDNGYVTDSYIGDSEPWT